MSPSEMKEPTLVVGPGIQVIVRNDLPKGTAYLVDAATITEQPPDGTVIYPFRGLEDL